MGALDIPRAGWPKYELSEKPILQLVTSCSSMRGHLLEDCASSGSAAPPKPGRAGALNLVALDKDVPQPTRSTRIYILALRMQTMRVAQADKPTMTSSTRTVLP